MRSLFLSTIIAAIFILTSCTDEDPKQPPFRLKEFTFGYLESNSYRTSMPTYHLSPNNCCIIEYKDGKVSKVIYKNSFPQPMPVDGSTVEAIDTYHDFFYNGNLVVLIKKADSNHVLNNQEKRQLTLDKKGRIIKRINYETKDTIEYFYSEMGSLSKSIYNNVGGYSTIVSNYFFDSNKNLVRITSELANKSGRKYHIFEYFEDYDTGINGFKNLGIIEGAFIRSLSQNNFNVYSSATYDDNNTLLDSMRSTLYVRYDNKGYPIYGDCSMK